MRSGSANLFAAQARAYRAMGFDVAVVAVPHDHSLVSSAQGYWNTIVAEFQFAPDHALHVNRSADRQRRFVSGSYWRWLAAGRGTAIAVQADMATHSRLQPEFIELLRSSPLALIHVNHCMNMGFARRLARWSVQWHATPPAVILETHDIQAERYQYCDIANPFTGTIDSAEALARDEADLCGGASALVHLTRRDCAHFETLLPDREHFVIRPTLRAEPGDVDWVSQKPPIDFAYIGNGHRMNVRSIEWFLSHVIPLLADSGLKIRIAGAVSDGVRKSNPDLHAAHSGVWLEEISSVYGLYASARFMIAPTIVSSGISIKLIEAMAMGRFVVASPAAVEAFEGIAGLEEAVIVAGDAARFAAAMRALAARGTAVNRAGRSLYQRHFSNACYLGALREVVRKVST